MSIFIAVYLLWQLVVPATYYFSENKSDERFAWRMFSAFGRKLKSCEVDILQKQMALDENAQGVLSRPARLLVGVWAAQLKRNRQAVVDKLLRHRCQQSPWMVAVTLVRRCPQGDGSETVSGQLAMNCLTGEVRGSLGEP